MRAATISISDLFEFEGRELPPGRPDTAAVTAMARRQFSFLPEPLKIEINGSNVTVTFPAESESAQQEAARLADRAAKRASAGEFKKAIPIYKRVLELHPTLHQARRDLAMVCMEVGDLDAARNHLIEVLRLKPDDPWSWVVLGNTYAKSPDDWPTAEKFLRRALEIAPGDPWALNALATIAGQRGQTADALGLFRDAVRSSPGFPNALYGMAVTYHRGQQPDQALTALEDLFKHGRKLDARSQGVFDQARTLYAQLQEMRAGRDQSDAFKAVENFRAQTERESGFPIQITEGEFKDTTGATIQMAWKHGRDHHLIKFRTGVEEVVRTHLLAHELVHLELESQARRAGTNKFFISTEQTEAAALDRLQPDLRKLKQSGYPEGSVASLAKAMVRGTTGFLYNCPLDMIIESRLRERMPALHAAQFLSVARGVYDAHKTNTTPEIRRITPGLILRASLAMNAAYCLLLDDLFHGATDYAGLYRREESFGLAQKLHRHWRERSSQLQPGEEYALVDEFAGLLGLRGWYAWRPDPGAHEPTAPPRQEGTTNAELLRAKEPAAVVYLLDALQRYDTLPVDKLREIAFEIGLVGRQGLDYASPEPKYTLKALPGEQFSGLHLMCLMFAGFKRLAPEHDLGMDLEEPWLRALEMYQAGRRG